MSHCWQDYLFNLLTAVIPSFDTVVTVRSEEKGKRILEAHPDTPKEKLSFVIVKDVAQEGAFDKVSNMQSKLISKLQILTRFIRAGRHIRSPL